MIKIVKYPYPYKAWFTIANDPDNTLLKDWHELNSFIWRTLKLPLANSLFIESYNHNLPNQVNLSDNEEIVSQKHDTIHTWGDYMYSRNLGFDRDKAIEACSILKKYAIQPKIWIDHSQFEGNLLHGKQALGGIVEKKDMSNHIYENYKYTLDLIQKIGIYYIWDGCLTTIIGQDRKLYPWTYFKAISTNFLKSIVKFFIYKLAPSEKIKNILKISIPKNIQYFPYEFEDGSKMYCFTRFGTWPLADIYGLGKVISVKNIDKLIQNNGTMIAYTHLGKRPASKMKENFHIPQDTKTGFIHIKQKYLEKKLMISSVSDLLDYLILRDSIKWDASKNILQFIPDKIRYKSIDQADLSGKNLASISIRKKI